MIYRKSRKLLQQGERTAGVLVLNGRTGWVAGMHWTQSGATGLLNRLRLQDTHWVTSGKGTGRVTGLVSPGKIRRGVKLYSLASVFQSAVGGSSHGLYRLDDDSNKWVFLATVRDQLTVMADVTGTLQEVCTARNHFLTFNDPGEEGWRCVADHQQNISWKTLVEGLSSQNMARARLKETSLRRPLTVIAIAAVMMVAGAWIQNESSQAARDAAIEASRKVVKVIKPEEAVQPEKLPGPWATRFTVPAFLKACWATRSQTRISIVGWRVSVGECDEQQQGLRLHYEAVQGSTIDNFDRRVIELYGHPATFDFVDGGKNGNVFIPFGFPDVHSLQDEPLRPANERLKSFISHMQRKTVPVQLSEVKQPETLPGTKNEQPKTDWQEYTFTLSTGLMPELLLEGMDARGVRISSISYTVSPQGLYHYTLRGSLYAKK
ncbi:MULTISPECIES: type 4b pilus protein PilO2 [Citrobacter]|uniref:type 4b pilus protein PilO2 n=1 Tax=Citrobacter freundii complex sp. CFNIH2 TaxID=2066049 RepID=UPI000C86CE33|nr:type 4b pilus protein PilO2 [Citrobacter freundii complex sp. CFNIH2]